MHSLTVIFQSLPAILPGILVTIGNVAIALGIGLLLGTPFAIGQVYGPRWIRRLVSLYVWFFRGVPILVLLFLFYGFFISLGLPARPFIIACLVLGCTSASYQSQIFRGAMESLPAGQMKAARAGNERPAGHNPYHTAANRAALHTWLGQSGIFS